MSELESLLVFLSDPRLAPHAIGDVPAWLWSADASRVLWGNPTAAAIFNAASPAALGGRAIDPKGTAALQIARLAGTLPHGASPRLERLRGFGGRMGGALLCACSRITLANRTPAILVVATEAAGARLPLAEQARRLLADVDDGAALFAVDGSLLAATPAAQLTLGPITALTALGAAQLGAAALASGRADGDSKIGKISLHRIGTEQAAALLATLESGAESTRLTEPAAPLQVAATAVATTPENPSVSAPIPPPPAALPWRPAPAQPPPVSNEKSASAPKPEPPRTASPASERRQPLRFVWQMDETSCFTLGSDEFKALLGAETAAVLGRPWAEIAQKLSLDPEGQIARAFASHDTWSGISVAFPVEDSVTRLSVELSGLPVFDRDRNFLGYRGFGVCRDLAHMTRLAQARHKAASPTAPREEPPVFRDDPPQARPPEAENIVPFPTAPAEGSPTLTPVERKAFSELANRLSARLRGQKDRLEQPAATVPEHLPPPAPPPAPAILNAAPSELAAARTPSTEQRPILDRLPIGVLVYRLDNLIYANRAFLDWTGYDQLRALEDAGGLDALFVEPKDKELGDEIGRAHV